MLLGHVKTAKEPPLVSGHLKVVTFVGTSSALQVGLDTGIEIKTQSNHKYLEHRV